MNLYTRIWLKLAPKGWQVVSTNYFNDRAHQLKELRRERDALVWIIKDLREGYDRLRHALMLQCAANLRKGMNGYNAGEAFTCT